MNENGLDEEGQKRVKGRNAEIIVEKMFNELGLEIHFSGAENYVGLVKGIINGRKLVHDDEFMKLFKIPDFIAVINNGLFFIEVKYRQHGRFDEKDIPRLKILKEVWKPAIILVSNNSRYKVPIFQVVPHPYNLDEERNPVEARSILESGWGIKPEVLKMCERLIISEITGPKENEYGYKENEL